MYRRKVPLIAFILLSIIHLFIFLNREKFRYIPYADYEELYKACNASCIGKWSNFKEGYPLEELQSARILADSINRNDPSTADRALSLARFLVNRFHHRLGKPNSWLLQQSPWQQFNSLQKNDSLQIWCSNYAQIFSWLCWSQGITNRVIEIMKKGDRHVVNEVYLPDQKEWMLLDLTSNLLTFQKNNHFLNLVQVRQTMATDPLLESWRLENDTLRKINLQKEVFPVSYYQTSHPLIYYHSMNYFKTLHWWYRLKAYVWPVAWYDIYEEERKGNLLFHLKQLLLLLWIISFLAILTGRTKFKA